MVSDPIFQFFLYKVKIPNNISIILTFIHKKVKGELYEVVAGSGVVSCRPASDPVFFGFGIFLGRSESNLVCIYPEPDPAIMKTGS